MKRVADGRGDALCVRPRAAIDGVDDSRNSAPGATTMESIAVRRSGPPRIAAGRNKVSGMRSEFRTDSRISVPDAARTTGPGITGGLAGSENASIVIGG